MQKFATYETLENLINQLLESKEQILLAIDGNSGAGKSSLATKLANQFECNLFHMDDFFLQPEQRTPERYQQPGGNVDYERFYSEVLHPLRERKAFQYRKFDCQTMTFADMVQVQPKKLNIIEGSYSHHAALADHYDLKVFLQIDSVEQSRRILKRNGPVLYSRFMQEWIPMENKYFSSCAIPNKATLVLSGDNLL